MNCKPTNAGTLVIAFCLLILGLVQSISSFSQDRIVDLRDELVRGPGFYGQHHSIKPILIDTLNYFPDIRLKKRHSNLYQAIVFRHLIFFSDSTVNFSVDPVMNFQYGYNVGPNMGKDSVYKTNTRGIKVEGNIGKNFTFVTVFYESQSRLMPYINNRVQETGASIGLGRGKAFTSTGEKSFFNKLSPSPSAGFDFSLAMGMINWRPSKHAEIWFGHGKNFIGNGYRSLLLSDNTTSYPHLRLAYSFFNNKVKYQTIFAQLSTGRRFGGSVSEPAFITKGATFNYLSFSPSSMFEVGFFEGTIFNRRDRATGRQTPIEPMQFNPLIGLNAVSFSLTDPNANVLIGLNSVFRPGNFLSFYGQVMMDNTKSGLQLGISKSNLLVKNLFGRLEFNTVKRGAYANSDSLMNYTNWLQPLAHPMGAGFSEVVTTVGYRYKRIIMNLQSSVAWFPKSYGGEGSNLALAYNGDPVNTMASTYFYMNPTIGFIINPSRNWQFNVGGIIRNVTTGGVADKTSFIFVGLSTNLNNLYYDF